MLKGILVVNEFNDWEQFLTLYKLLLDSALRCGLKMELKKTGEIWCRLGRGEGSELAKELDFVLFWDKDIHLARALEALGLRLFNPREAIELCDDKALTYIELERHQLPQPLTFIAPRKLRALEMLPEGFIKAASDTLGYPLIFKDCFGSFGAQVFLMENEDALREQIIFTGERQYLLQKYIAAAKGRDLRLYVTGEHVAAAIERRNDSDFRANITNGGTALAYSPTPEEEKLALSAARALSLDFAGVDLMVDSDGHPLVCEVNSNAHYMGLMEATGINPGDHIMEYIKMTLACRD